MANGTNVGGAAPDGFELLRSTIGPRKSITPLPVLGGPTSVRAVAKMGELPADRGFFVLWCRIVGGAIPLALNTLSKSALSPGSLAAAHLQQQAHIVPSQTKAQNHP